MSTTAPLTLGSIALDRETRVLSGPAGTVQLSDRYFSLAERLLRRAGAVVQHSDLISALYPDPDAEPDNSTTLLYQGIGRLRTIVEMLGGSSVRISSVIDVGYRMHVRGK